MILYLISMPILCFLWHKVLTVCSSVHQKGRDILPIDSTEVQVRSRVSRNNQHLLTLIPSDHVCKLQLQQLHDLHSSENIYSEQIECCTKIWDFLLYLVVVQISTQVFHIFNIIFYQWQLINHSKNSLVIRAPFQPALSAQAVPIRELRLLSGQLPSAPQCSGVGTRGATAVNSYLY